MSKDMKQHHASINPVIGAAIGATAGILGCEKGPECLRQSPYNADLRVPLQWQETITFEQKNEDIVNDVVTFSMQLAQKTTQQTDQGSFFWVLGGDHACAIGTWVGVRESMAQRGELGLIWIDAHLDAHTPTSTPSGNIHGMPVAVLLGYGDQRLLALSADQPIIKPEHLVMIGIRSYEPEEHVLLSALGVKIYDIDAVQQRGMSAILNESIDYLSNSTVGFGISLDLDALNAEEIPAVGTPVENGILLDDLKRGLSVMPKDQLLCVEIAEFNPLLDQHGKTEQAIFAIINAVNGEMHVR